MPAPTPSSPASARSSLSSGSSAQRASESRSNTPVNVLAAPSGSPYQLLRAAFGSYSVTGPMYGRASAAISEKVRLLGARVADMRRKASSASAVPAPVIPSRASARRSPAASSSASISAMYLPFIQ